MRPDRIFFLSRLGPLQGVDAPLSTFEGGWLVTGFFSGGASHLERRLIPKYFPDQPQSRVRNSAETANGLVCFASATLSA